MNLFFHQCLQNLRQINQIVQHHTLVKRKITDYLMYLALIIDTLEIQVSFPFTKIWSSPVAVLLNIIQNSGSNPNCKGIKRDLIIKMKTISKDSFYYNISSWEMRLVWTVWGFRGAVHGWALCIKFLVWFLWLPNLQVLKVRCQRHKTHH